MAPLLHGRTAADAAAAQVEQPPSLPGVPSFRPGIREVVTGVRSGTLDIPRQPCSRILGPYLLNTHAAHARSRASMQAAHGYSVSTVQNVAYERASCKRDPKFIWAFFDVTLITNSAIICTTVNISRNYLHNFQCLAESRILYPWKQPTIKLCQINLNTWCRSGMETVPILRSDVRWAYARLNLPDLEDSIFRRDMQAFRNASRASWSELVLTCIHKPLPGVRFRR